MNKKIVLFDFDGVVVDSLNLGFSINKEMMPDLEYEEWAGWFEGNLYQKIRKEHANEKSHNDFHAKYIAKIDTHEPIEGMAETVEKLAAKYTLIIISSSITHGIEIFLTKHKLDKYFTEVLGADIHRSKVEKINMVLNKYKIRPSETLIVTDSIGDIKEAKSVGIGSVAVCWGVHNKKKLESVEPNCLIEHPFELLPEIDNLLLKEAV